MSPKRCVHFLFVHVIILAAPALFFAVSPAALAQKKALCFASLTKPSNPDEAIAATMIPGYFGLSAQEWGDLNSRQYSVSRLRTALESLPRSSAAESLFQQIQQEERLARLFVITHQSTGLQPGVAKLLREDKVFRDVPRVALVSDSFPVYDATLAQEVSLFLYSAEGSFGRVPTPVVTEAYLAGGYCEYCLGRTVDELIQSARRQKSRDLTLMFLTNSIYPSSGANFAQVLRQFTTTLAQKVEFAREHLLSHLRPLTLVQTKPAELAPDGKIIIDWSVTGNDGLGGLKLHVVLDPRAVD